MTRIDEVASKPLNGEEVLFASEPGKTWLVPLVTSAAGSLAVFEEGSFFVIEASVAGMDVTDDAGVDAKEENIVLLQYSSFCTVLLLMPSRCGRRAIVTTLVTIVIRS